MFGIVCTILAENHEKLAMNVQTAATAGVKALRIDIIGEHIVLAASFSAGIV